MGNTWTFLNRLKIQSLIVVSVIFLFSQCGLRSADVEDRIATEPDSLQLFLNGFNSTSDLSISVDNESHDMSRIIPPGFERVHKIQDENMCYGDHFLIRDSIHALVFHTEFVFNSTSPAMFAGLESKSSDILLLDPDGQYVGRVYSAFRDERHVNEIGEDYAYTSNTTIDNSGKIIGMSLERYGHIVDGKWNDIEDIGYKRVSIIDETGKLNMGQREVVSYKSNTINKESRQAILDDLAEIIDLTFVSVVKIDGAYLRIKESCMENAKFRFPTAANTGTFDFTNEWYYPIIVNEYNEYSANFIVSVEKEATGRYHLETKDMNSFKEEKGVVDLDGDPTDLYISLNENGHWSIDGENGISYVDEKFASTLAFAEEPCTNQ